MCFIAIHGEKILSFLSFSKNSQHRFWAPRSSGLRRRARSGQWPSRFWPSTESSPCPSGLNSTILYLLIWPRPRWSTESLPCLFVTPLPRADPSS
ncbi:hypothetical protein BO83DRAFT_25770 [Aspergillus eucalypticola CBS 122712]|uniref:Uncharacterized protein n=1 Tax=Aspergillus eucalypticola (strain CBS 122712 / IBT 29274) TaxID=1448314 RepID=A0A317VQE5_ASPEC|nr:uncharacterized protein BO83DRAFT_25770 [Aspergillus eucalypticola CBS 122712]PWY74110.1 hypothetical protein BO83DRAFT_25770 [Aspergillus eucalypticola CBS 122712]